jgi:hypothetical protein
MIANRAGGLAQVAEYFRCKHGALSSNPVPQKKGKKVIFMLVSSGRCIQCYCIFRIKCWGKPLG